MNGSRCHLRYLETSAREETSRETRMEGGERRLSPRPREEQRSTRERAHTRTKGRLTLTIGSHLRHGGILHHSCRTTASSHEGWVRTGGESTGLAPHGKLLCVIHHLLRLVGGRGGLQVSALGWWGTVEDRARGGIWVAIRS